MRWLLAISAVATFTSAVTAPASAQRFKDRTPCPPAKERGITVVATTPQISVYAIGSIRSGTAGYIGCVRRNRKRVQLSQFSSGVRESASVPVVNGRYVAMSVTLNRRDPSGPTKVIRAWDVVAGRRILDDVERFAGSRIPHAEPSDPPSSFLVTRRGDVGWIADNAFGDRPLEVRYAPRGQPVRLLDSAPDVVPDSLALTDSYVYWQRGAAAQVARR